uniref:Uncharacterized protein n=1 Tax=Glossina brevipalpis TaxID=37001 RepID=A0A1A9WJV4_9MUSC
MHVYVFLIAMAFMGLTDYGILHRAYPGNMGSMDTCLYRSILMVPLAFSGAALQNMEIFALYAGTHVIPQKNNFKRMPSIILCRTSNFLIATSNKFYKFMISNTAS